jgi:hypothetical protein
MSRTISLLAASAALLAIFTSVVSGSPTFYTDEAAFDANFPAPQVINFAGVAPPGARVDVLPTMYPGISFVPDDIPRMLFTSATFVGPFVPGTAPFDFVTTEHFGADLDIRFSQPVAAVGLHVSLLTRSLDDDGGPALLALFPPPTGTTTVSIDSRDIQASGVGTFDTFFGFSGYGPIGSISIRTDRILGANQVVAIGDLKYANIPEPSTLALGLLGALGAYLLARGRHAS